jgi:hypothetical protein
MLEGAHRPFLTIVGPIADRCAPWHVGLTSSAKPAGYKTGISRPFPRRTTERILFAIHGRRVYLQ